MVYDIPTLPRLDKPISALTPKTTRPVILSKSNEAWRRLQQIRHVEVKIQKAAHGANIFSISLYMHHNPNRISTNIETPTLLIPSSRRFETLARLTEAPDLEIVRTSADLDALRHSVWAAVRRYHPVHCALCGNLSVQTVTTLAYAVVLSITTHRSSAKRAKQMREFVLRVLRELHTNKLSCVKACHAQHELPLLLHRFLFGSNDEDATDRTETSAAEVEPNWSV